MAIMQIKQDAEKKAFKIYGPAESLLLFRQSNRSLLQLLLDPW